MGKRIKWLSEAEQESIRNGSLDYCKYYSPDFLSENDSDRLLRREDLIEKYRVTEKKRSAMIKSHSKIESSSPLTKSLVGFTCPNHVKETLSDLRNRLRSEAILT